MGEINNVPIKSIDIYKQYPIYLVLSVYTAMSGKFQYEVVLNENSSLVFFHNDKKITEKILQSKEVVDLIILIRQLQIPFTSETVLEGHVCDGSSMELSISSDSYQFNTSFYSGQDEESNNSQIAVMKYVENLIDASILNSTFGYL